MRLIDRYISNAVFSAMLMVMAVVLSLDLVFGFIAEVDDVKERYQVFDAAIYILYTLPRRVYDYLPLGAFMGCLVGLGALAKNSELTVVRAAGVPVSRIVYATLKPALLVVLFGVFLGEFVAPTTEKIAQSEKALKRGAQSNMVYGQGLWHKEGSAFIHVNAVEPNGALHGVSIKQYDDSRVLQHSLFARRALYHENGWTLIDVEKSSFEGGRVVVTRDSAVEWLTELNPKLLNVLIVKPDNLSMSGLYAYSTYLAEQGLDGGLYVLSFWKKLLQPLTTLSLVLVAISFVFGPLRSVAMGTRVFVGLIVGLVFKYVQDLLGPASLVFGFEPALATLAPILFCMFLGALLMRRAA
jgi:lipopolysaccharide export system permease protein